MKFFKKTTERKVNIAEKDVRQQKDCRYAVTGKRQWEVWRKETKTTGADETNKKEVEDKNCAINIQTCYRRTDQDRPTAIRQHATWGQKADIHQTGSKLKADRQENASDKHQTGQKGSLVPGDRRRTRKLRYNKTLRETWRHKRDAK